MKIPHETYKKSSKSLRNLKSILEKPLTHYNDSEVDFLHQEINKHEAIISKYHSERTGIQKSNKIGIEVEIKLNLNNFEKLMEADTNDIHKFKVSGFNEYKHSKEVRNVVDIDMPFGGVFTIQNNIVVSHIVLTQMIDDKQIDDMSRIAYTVHDVQPNDNVGLMKSFIHQLQEIYYKTYG